MPTASSYDTTYSTVAEGQQHVYEAVAVDASTGGAVKTLTEQVGALILNGDGDVMVGESALKVHGDTVQIDDKVYVPGDTIFINGRWAKVDMSIKQAAEL